MESKNSSALSTKMSSLMQPSILDAVTFEGNASSNSCKKTVEASLIVQISAFLIPFTKALFRQQQSNRSFGFDQPFGMLVSH